MKSSTVMALIEGDKYLFKVEGQPFFIEYKRLAESTIAAIENATGLADINFYYKDSSNGDITNEILEEYYSK